MDSSGNVYIADTGDNVIKEWNASTQMVSTLVPFGLYSPGGVAVDAAGNVYIADSRNNAVKEWNASTQMVSTLFSFGLASPEGVAVDAAGNVYIADTNFNAIKEWNASTQQVSTLVISGLSFPQGVAVDAAGNVCIADTGNNAIKEWNASTQRVSTLVFPGPSSGLSYPDGVAVDGSGNVYIADTGDNAVKEWNASTQMVSTLVSSGLSSPEGVAVDGSGNVYIADTGDNAVKEWNASTQQVSTLVSSGLSFPQGLAVDAAGNVYIADTGNFITDPGDYAIKEWNASTQMVSTLVSGAGTPSGVLLPDRVAVDATGNVYIADTLCTYIDGVPVASGGAIEEWNASSQQVSTLFSTPQEIPQGVAVDGSGNVYIAWTAASNPRLLTGRTAYAFPGVIEEWNVSTQQVSTLSVLTNSPDGIAVDAAGNIYLAETPALIQERVKAYLPVPGPPARSRRIDRTSSGRRKQAPSVMRSTWRIRPTRRFRRCKSRVSQGPRINSRQARPSLQAMRTPGISERFPTVAQSPGAAPRISPSPRCRRRRRSARGDHHSRRRLRHADV